MRTADNATIKTTTVLVYRAAIGESVFSFAPYREWQRLFLLDRGNLPSERSKIRELEWDG